MNELEIIQKCILGEIDIETFESELYTNADLQKVLSDNSVNYLKERNVYDYLIDLPFHLAEGKIDAIYALQHFLEQKGHALPSSKYIENHNLLLDTQPQYLDLAVDFFEKHIKPENFIGTKAELKKAIKDNYNKYFQYQSKPPKWVQSPQWLIENEKPLYFIGQIDIKHECFHDNGVVYLFLDTNTGEIKIVKQFY